MVLIVDDDVMIVEVLRRWLEREGYTVDVCPNGQEAFAKLRAGRTYDCMLLDVNMPVISGVELLLLMQSEGMEVPTIVMAGFGDFEEKEMKEFGSVVRFMAKPFAMQDMVAAVRQIVQPPAAPEPPNAAPAD